MSGWNIHVYPSAFTHESRILKITKTLAGFGIFERIVMLGVHYDGLAEIESVDEQREIWRLPRKSGGARTSFVWKVFKTMEWSIRVLWRLRGVRVDCINCHSLPTLPLCVVLRLWKRCRLVYDTHELETETIGTRGIRQRLLKIVERVLIGRVHATAVVSESIAEWYREAYALGRIFLVRNIPLRDEVPLSRSSRLRERIGIDDDAILFLYLGLIQNGRGIVETLESFAGLSQLARDHSRREVVFVGDGNLVPIVKSYAREHDNIHYHPAVPPSEVAEISSGADVGLTLILNDCLSYFFCLPNKFFQYLHAGIPPVVSDFPEMG